MAGKPYTMREMKAIVEYLVERKAYGELRGRKMWMEFANSDKTKRTWQSLKETFLKRILPDIQNPYYKLTMDQVRSFRQGIDVAEKEKNNRLEFRTVEENLNAQNQNGLTSVTKDNALPTTSHEIEAPTIIDDPPRTSIDDELGRVTGEDIKAAKIPSRSRSSVETLVLEYDNAEDVKRVLESPNETDETKIKTKSLKDKLVFEHSAPLTPLVRDLLNDFETESEASDAEPRLNIDEDQTNNVEPQLVEDTISKNIELENDLMNNKVDSTIDILETNNLESTELNGQVIKSTEKTANENQIQDNKKSHKNDEEVNSQSDENEHNNNNEINTDEHNNRSIQKDDDVMIIDSSPKSTTPFVIAESNSKTCEKTSDAIKNTTDCSIIANTGSSTQNISSDTLPNNQEALKDDAKKEIQKIKSMKTDKGADEAKRKENRLGKRSISKDSRDSKKLKLSDVKSKETNNEVATPVIEVLDSPSPIFPDKNSDERNTPITEICSNAPTSHDTEEQLNKFVEQRLENVNRSSTDAAKNDTDSMADKTNTAVTDDKNPCLISVSLFEEQFKNTKYSDSESDDAIKQKQSAEETQAKINKPEDVTQESEEAIVIPEEAEDVPQKAKDKKETEEVIEKKTTAETSNENDSNLDSSADCERQNRTVVNDKLNVQRERALANVFGFTHGFVASPGRKRRLSHRRRSHRRHHQRQSINVDSNSSGWTSESDSDAYVSPPRSRKNRQTKKYLKPKPGRILQDPEDGMLYVIFGKNMYPLVKDGRHIKNFLQHTPESGSDQEESFWRQKYMEEKKRVEEVRKLLKDAQKGNTAQQMNESTLCSASRKGINTHPSHRSGQNRNDDIVTPEVQNKVEAKEDKMVFQIAGCNGLKYSLEGGWNQISNAMPQVMRLLSETVSDNGKSKPAGEAAEQTKTKVGSKTRDDQIEVTSGASTPVLAAIDKDVHEKINNVEAEIFNEIKILEERQKEEEAKQNETKSPDSNVTKRKRGRPRGKSSSTIAKSLAKRVRSETKDSIQEKTKSTRTTKSKIEIANPEKIDEIKENSKMTTDNAENKETKQAMNKSNSEVKDDEFVSARSSRLREIREKSERNSSIEKATLGKRLSARSLRTPKKYDSDTSSNVNKKRPASSKSLNLRDFDDENARYKFPPKSNKNTTESKLQSLPEINIIPPQDMVGSSMDSAYGYEDSNPSPMKVFLLKRKRKISFTARNRSKNNRLSRRKTCPVLLEGPLLDSNNSSYFIPIRKSPSSFSSAIYRSDSFQLMMPKQKSSPEKLERIDEDNPSPEDPEIRHFDSISNSNKSNESDIVLEFNSSSVTLPVSPELSVVETMSVSRDMIKDLNRPTINEAQQNVTSQPMDYSEYMISNLDVSVPLMRQRCELRKSVCEIDENASKPEERQLKDGTVNLTASETLDRRLQELLLESTKKPSQTVNTQTPMEVDQTIATVKKPRQRKQKENVPMDVNESKVVTKKTRAKKRSSTPQKKKVVSKSKAPQDAIIQEEHIESCSAGRKSCPPVITFIPIEENANNSSDVTLNPAKNPKKKKDVIKVKIQKPTKSVSPKKPTKSLSQENVRAKSVGDGSAASNYSDSGINDTETISLVLKDCSMELIHNHSETCLQANECIGNNSVEFVRNSSVSIITLNSEQTEDSAFYKILDDDMVLFEDTPNNQDGQTEQDAAFEARASDELFQSPKTRYHSPYNSNSSLMTEDLSDSLPTPPTKWYLLEEDITNAGTVSNVPSFGSNLNQIFPITCAVPNLSTISEVSKDNEDSRKTGGC